MSTLLAAVVSLVQAIAHRVPDRTRAIAALLTAACIWGSAAAATKTALTGWPPMTLAVARWSIALAIILALLRRRGGRPVGGGGVALLGVTGLLVFYLFYSWGLNRTTAANGTLIGGGTPVLVALISAAALGERISARRGLGILCSLAGVTAIVAASASGSDGGEASLLGDVLVFGSTISWALYTVITRRVSSGGSALAVLAGTAAYGLAFMAPFAAWEVVSGALDRPRGDDLLWMLYLSLGPSFAAYLLWGYGLTRIEASQAAVYGNLMPLVGVILAAVLLDEALTAAMAAGGAAIITGAWLATTARSPVPAARDPA